VLHPPTVIETYLTGTLAESCSPDNGTDHALDADEAAVMALLLRQAQA